MPARQADDTVRRQHACYDPMRLRESVILTIGQDKYRGVPIGLVVLQPKPGIRTEVTGQCRPGLPVQRATGSIDCFDEVAVSHVWSDGDDAIDVERVLASIKHRSHTAQRNADKPNLCITLLPCRKDDFLAKALGELLTEIMAKARIDGNHVQRLPRMTHSLYETETLEVVGAITDPRQEYDQDIAASV